MRIIVTGGAGFIGSHIADAFIRTGHRVLVVDDLSSGKRQNINPTAYFDRIDIRDRSALCQAFRDFRPDYVSHQAALANVRESFDKPALYAEVNVLGSVNVLECCREVGVKKVIYASTGGAAYGEPQFLPVTEDHPICPLDPYGASKHHVEHYLRIYRLQHGLNFVTLRYPNVYGPRQDPHGEAGVVAIFAEHMIRGRPAVINGDGLQERDFLFVGDVARANVLALERGENREYNLGTGRGSTILEVFRLLARLTEYETVSQHGPPMAGEVRKIYLDTALARTDLEWAPETDLAEGLRLTVEEIRGEL